MTSAWRSTIADGTWPSSARPAPAKRRFCKICWPPTFAAGHGVACLDPHGDLSDSLLELIPKHRTNDVIVFDAGDASHPLSFNLLACDDRAKRPLVASGIVSAFKKIYGTMWGPRLEHILRNSLLALLEIPGSSLVQILPLLTMPVSEVSHQTAQDPAVRRFWEVEFAEMPARLRARQSRRCSTRSGILFQRRSFGTFSARPRVRSTFVRSWTAEKS